MLQQKFNILTVCISFSAGQGTLRNGKTYNRYSHPKMTVNAESTADGPVARDAERAEDFINGVSPDSIEEKIKANLESLSEQTSTLTQLLNQLIQESLARNFPTAGFRA